jgi:tetratricopeptide (TPR) repeat protein
MTLQTDDYSNLKRRLILRDALTFLTLLLVTVVLFLVTLFLFRSFASHRQELALRWSARGQSALLSGHPDQAVVALRTALSYTPGQRSYELLLAQALGEAGHIEESYNYFLGLWETQPGDGFINLSLARLAAKKNDPQAAINYYRASIYGTWEGDGVVRRREVRLELARFLLAHHDPPAARTELLIAAGNAPDDTSLTLTLAALLEQAGSPHDALTLYDKVLVQQPKNQTALLAAGRLRFEAGHFDDAHRLLQQAIQSHTPADQAMSPAVQTMLDNSTRILALEPSKNLPASERVARILRARDLAKKRFDACNAQISAASGLSTPLQHLSTQWSSPQASLSRSNLVNDPTQQDATMQLVFDTETQTARVCGPPTGDDALLLLLAQRSNALEP